MAPSSTSKASRGMSRRTVFGIPAALAFPWGVSAQAQTPPPHELVGRWLAEDIGGGGVIDRLQSTLEVREDGRAGGHTGCNAYRCAIHIAGDALTFSRIAPSWKSCGGAIGAQEWKFLNALSATRRFEIDALERKLILRTTDGGLTLRLARM